MDVRELRQLPDDRLMNELEDLKESMFNLRFQKSFGQLEDPNALRRARRMASALRAPRPDLHNGKSSARVLESR